MLRVSWFARKIFKYRCSPDNRVFKRAQAEPAKPAAGRGKPCYVVDGGRSLDNPAFAECQWLRTPYPVAVTRAERYFIFKLSVRCGRAWSTPSGGGVAMSCVSFLVLSSFFFLSAKRGIHSNPLFDDAPKA